MILEARVAQVGTRKEVANDLLRFKVVGAFLYKYAHFYISYNDIPFYRLQGQLIDFGSDLNLNNRYYFAQKLFYTEKQNTGYSRFGITSFSHDLSDEDFYAGRFEKLPISDPISLRKALEKVKWKSNEETAEQAKAVESAIGVALSRLNDYRDQRQRSGDDGHIEKAFHDKRWNEVGQAFQNVAIIANSKGSQWHKK